MRWSVNNSGATLRIVLDFHNFILITHGLKALNCNPFPSSPVGNSIDTVFHGRFERIDGPTCLVNSIVWS